MRRAFPLVAAAVALVVTVACEPPNPNVTTVVGDSLTMTTLLAGEFPAGWDIHSMLGWEAEDATPGLYERANDPARSPARVAIALCANDGAQHAGKGPEWGDGFTATDAAQLRDLRSTLHPDTVVSWVLPDYTGTDPVFAAGINACRTWVAGYAASMGDCTVDWRAVNTSAHMDADGVHLTAAGKAAYGDMIAARVASCG